MAEDAGEIGPSRKDIDGGKPEDAKTTNESGEKHGKENTRKRHPSKNTVVQFFIDRADKERSALGADVPTQAEIDEGIAETEAFLKEQVPYPIVPDIHPEKPVMQDADYHSRDLAIIEVMNRYKENPEDAGLKDLAKIIEGEEKDLKAKMDYLSMKFVDQLSSVLTSKTEWLRLELNFIDSAKKALAIMLRGGKIKDEDPRSMALDEYVRSKLDQFERSKEAEKDNPELQETADRALAIFEAFYEQESEYEPPKEKN